jgi:SHAQKYF class myb-like DNA-binding protein
MKAFMPFCDDGNRCGSAFQPYHKPNPINLLGTIETVVAKPYEEKSTPSTFPKIEAQFSSAWTGVVVPSNKSPQKFKGGPWTKEEHSKFLEAMNMYGNDWTKVKEYIGTRLPKQIRSHAQKYAAQVRRRAIKKAKADPLRKKDVFAITKEFRNVSALQGSKTRKGKRSPPLVAGFEEKRESSDVNFLAKNLNEQSGRMKSPPDTTIKKIKAFEDPNPRNGMTDHKLYS